MQLIPQSLLIHKLGSYTQIFVGWSVRCFCCFYVLHQVWQSFFSYFLSNLQCYCQLYTITPATNQLWCQDDQTEIHSETAMKV